MNTMIHNSACQWCGMIHVGACPRVKALEYHPNGSLKRVEFYDASAAPRPATITIRGNTSPGREWIEHPNGDDWIVHPA